MKKKLAVVLTAVLAWSAVPAYAGVPAAPIMPKVTVNGEAKDIEAYHINGENYFKLRDVAYVLNDTNGFFAIDWDDEQNVISLNRLQKYKPTGNEMKASGTKDIKDAVESTSTVLIQGDEVALPAYTINGNTYFRLKDLAETIRYFNVAWDDATQTTAITTIIVEKAIPEGVQPELGIYKEITGIWSDYGMITEGIVLTEDCPYTRIDVISGEICGEPLESNGAFPGASLAKYTGQPDAYRYDFVFQYTFPENKDILLLNGDPEHPDYGKTNPIRIEYELTADDAEPYRFTEEYNLLYKGDGGLWIS